MIVVVVHRSFALSLKPPRQLLQIGGSVNVNDELTFIGPIHSLQVLLSDLIQTCSDPDQPCWVKSPQVSVISLPLHSLLATDLSFVIFCCVCLCYIHTSTPSCTSIPLHPNYGPLSPRLCCCFRRDGEASMLRQRQEGSPWEWIGLVLAATNCGADAG